ncbi:MAG TPA: hypothetical protein VHC70_00740 [Phycisphaerales bacterium]|nr:hypothetical protein [Phycisphaerales bacterium]
MRPHPRIRRTIKWGGAAMTALLAAVWVWSGSRMVEWSTSNGLWIGLLNGRVEFTPVEGFIPPGTGRVRWYKGNDFSLRWACSWHRDKYGWLLILPLWPSIAILAVPTGVAWRKDAAARRRERAAQCRKCRYDRTGIPVVVVCPECGTPPRYPIAK